MSFIKEISRIPENTFKLFFWKFFFGYLPIGLTTALLALFNVKPITFNEEAIGGILGFIIALLMSPFFALIITVATWLLFMLGHLIIKLIEKLVE